MARHDEPVGRVRAVCRQWNDTLARGEYTAGQRSKPTSSAADGRASATDRLRQRADPGEVPELAPTPLTGAEHLVDEHLARFATGPVAESFVLLAHLGLVLTFGVRSEEHTSELPSLMRLSYAVFCL